MSLASQLFIYKNGLEITLTILALAQGIFVLKKRSTKNVALLHALVLLLMAFNFILLSLYNIFQLHISDLVYAIPITCYGPLSYFMTRKLLNIAPPISTQQMVATLIVGYVAFFMVGSFGLSQIGLEYYWNLIFIGIALYQSAGATMTTKEQQQWLMQYLGGFGIIFVAYLPVFYAQKFFPDIFLTLKVPFTVAFVVFLINNFRHQINRKQILNITAPSDSNLVLAQELKGAILQYMNQVKPYLKFDFDVSTMASDLGCTERALSEAINKLFKKNFNQFINEYRVEAAVLKMKEDPHCTKLIKEIMYDSGFNHKVSFNNAFKLKYRTTPGMFRRSLYEKGISPKTELASIAE